MTQTEVPLDPQTDAPIVARPALVHRLKISAVALMFLGFGIWCVRDGFFVWPRHNAEARARGIKEPHPGFDVPLNQLLGIVLPLAGLALLGHMYRRSRGRYELSGTVISVPGHRSVPLESILRIDKRRWERKGIAEIEYDNGDGPRTFVLDDFYYQRQPTDQILARIEEFAKVTSASPEEAGPGLASPAPAPVVPKAPQPVAATTAPAAPKPAAPAAPTAPKAAPGPAAPANTPAGLLVCPRCQTRNQSGAAVCIRCAAPLRPVRK
jgi:hypothetical protein